jgi:hypothetical protein
MALDRFRAPPLPNPSGEYDPQYVRQLIRALELYFSQLDSNTPNHAQQYTADVFVGGSFHVTLQNITTTEKNALTATAGRLVWDTTLGKVCVYNGSVWQSLSTTDWV